MMKKLFVTIFSITLSLTFVTAIFAATYSYTTINIPSTTWTRLYGINDYGEIVGITSNTSQAFVRNPDGSYTSIVYPDEGAYGTTAYGINNNSVIVGQYQIGSGGASVTPYYYDGSYHSFEPIDSSNAMGINDSSIIVGFGYDPFNYDGMHAFMYDAINSNTTFLNYPNYGNAAAYDINNLGQIVGYYTDDDGDHGFIYSISDESWQTFDAGTNGDTYFSGINDSGMIVGQYYDDDYYSTFSFIMDDNGTITPIEGFLYDYKVTAMDINNSGQIVGWYNDSSNNENGFLINTVPIPGAVWLLGSGIIGIVGIRRKFQK